LDDAPKNAISLRVLILYSRSSNPTVAMADDRRFGRFASILDDGGFTARLASPDSIAMLDALIAEFGPDLVFSAPDHLSEFSPMSAGAAFPANARINVHGWLEGRGIPYVGSPPDIIELALSKTALKEKWVRDGISTPEFLSLNSGSDLSAVDRTSIPPFPCIVKPSDAGNSRGITKDSVVFDMKGLASLVASLGRDFRHILIEHYLGLYPDFREITCACIGNGEERLLLPVEIVFIDPPGIHVVTTEDKDGSRTEARPIADGSLREAAQAFAAAAFSSAGDIRDYSRCDMIFAGGKFWAIEINGQPMIPDAWFEACARQAHLSEKQYILAIVEAALSRSIRAYQPLRRRYDV